ncbi:MAG: hypothetical protein WCS39_08560, partial [Bacteroidales bacterium]
MTDNIGNKYFWIFNKSLCSSESIQLNLKDGSTVVDVFNATPCLDQNSVIYLDTAEAKLFKFIPEQHTPAVNTISQNTTWNKKRVVHETIHVTSSVTFTITDTILFGSNAKIVINPGGKLIIDGGTLTNACEGELWGGIEVYGTPTSSQNVPWSDQGVVILQNDAVIENAVCGIRIGKEINIPVDLNGTIIT